MKTINNKTNIQHFFNKIEMIPFHTCWEWMASKNIKGYGKFTYKNKTHFSHRFSYELHKGPIPKGLVIDHLCRNRGCVNPNHLEAVTNKENIMRGNGLAVFHKNKTHCKNGHEFNFENTQIRPNGTRRCRLCEKLKARLKKLNSQGAGTSCTQVPPQ